MALMVSVYLIVDFLISGTFDYRVFIMFVLMVIVVIWGIVDWRSNYVLIRQKENELRLYGSRKNKNRQRNFKAYRA